MVINIIWPAGCTIFQCVSLAAELMQTMISLEIISASTKQVALPHLPHDLTLQSPRVLGPCSQQTCMQWEQRQAGEHLKLQACSCQSAAIHKFISVQVESFQTAISPDLQAGSPFLEERFILSDVHGAC